MLPSVDAVDITKQIQQALERGTRHTDTYTLATLEIFGQYFHLEAILMDQDENGHWFAAGEDPNDEAKLNDLCNLCGDPPMPVCIDDLWWTIYITPYSA